MIDRYLILMRHAKSSWANDSLSDFERPLNERGRESAPRMGNWLDENAFLPDCVLCSTAVRAQQTADLVGTTWRHSHTKIDLQELYLASPHAIVDAIQQHGPLKSKKLLLIGHNPGFEHLASLLSGQAIVMPTAAIAVFNFGPSNTWMIDTSTRQSKLEHFVVPREIHPSLD